MRLPRLGTHLTPSFEPALTKRFNILKFQKENWVPGGHRLLPHVTPSHPELPPPIQNVRVKAGSAPIQSCHGSGGGERSQTHSSVVTPLSIMMVPRSRSHSGATISDAYEQRRIGGRVANTRCQPAESEWSTKEASQATKTLRYQPMSEWATSKQDAGTAAWAAGSAATLMLQADRTWKLGRHRWGIHLDAGTKLDLR